MFAFSVTGCARTSESQSAVQEVSESAPTQEIAENNSPAAVQNSAQTVRDEPRTASNLITIPPQWQFEGVGTVQVADSWGARVATLPPRDREWLNDLNNRYAGALGFSSKEEQERLIRQGFPMPEEWLAARALTDDALEKLAKSGNAKAQMLHIDRVGSQIAPVQEAGKGLGNSTADRELLRRYSSATLMADELLRNTKSPFSAYLRGQLFSSGSQYTPPEYYAGGIMLAKQLGDVRADAIRKNFAQSHPDMDANTLMSAYSSMQSTLDRR